MAGEIDLERLANIAERLVFVPVASQFGALGMTSVKLLVSAVRQIYGQVSTERLPSGLTVVREVVERPTASLAGAQPINRAEGLLTYTDGPLTVELVGGGDLRALAEERIAADFGATSLVYRWHPDEGEHVYLGGERYDLPNPTNAPTSLAIPYFVDLDDALEHYALHKARLAGQCFVLKAAWRDEGRLMLVQKPEEVMRKSLHAHLVSSLRNYRSVEVMAEQVVDESHPVDLKVTWLGTNKVALIEVKWMGKSAPLDRSAPLTRYSDARALEGAKQLAEYLDWYNAYSPVQDARGYLIVLDARRWGVSPTSTEVSRASGMYYQRKEVAYPDAVLLRGDFAPPRRVFCEPRCAG